MVQGSSVWGGRAFVFLAIALGVPLGACKFLSKADNTADAGPAPTTTTVIAATTATAAPINSGAASAVAPLTSTAPVATTPGPRVAVKLPDGGTVIVDASLSPDGAVVLPPAFQFPKIPGFDAGVFQVPRFDAAALAVPTLPPGFPQIPGFGGVDSGKK